MVLKMKKTTALSGEVVIDGILVMTLQSNISSDASSNTYTTDNVVDQKLYNENTKLCREKIEEFRKKVYEIEDHFIEEGFKTTE